MNWEAYLNIPNTGQEFEILMQKVCYIIYRKAFTLFGRNGESQHGIDLYTSGFEICVQCKKYTGRDAPDRLIEEFKRDFEMANNHFDGRMKVYVLATTVPTDTKVQEFVEKTQISNQAIQIKVLFWNEILEVIKENPELVPQDECNISDYDRGLPNLSTTLWWMETGIKVKNTKVVKVGSCEEYWDEDLNNPWNSDFDISDNDEAMLLQAPQWLDDSHPILAAPLFLSTRKSGIYFLISNWTYGLGQRMTEYAQERNILGADWVEIQPHQHKLLSKLHAGTVISISINNMQDITLAPFIQRWIELGKIGQLIFNFCYKTDSVEQWNEKVIVARTYIQRLHKGHPDLPISLLTTYNPMRAVDTLINKQHGSDDAVLIKQPVEWLTQNPEKISSLLSECANNELKCKEWFPALSIWPSITEQLFKYIGLSKTIYLLYTCQPNWDNCAVALYQLFRQEGDKWISALKICIQFCSSPVRDTVENFIAGTREAISGIEPMLYCLLTEGESVAYSQNPHADVGVKLAMALNNDQIFSEIARSSQGDDKLAAIGKILLPDPSGTDDELTQHFREMIRPLY